MIWPTPGYPPLTTNFARGEERVLATITGQGRAQGRTGPRAPGSRARRGMRVRFLSPQSQESLEQNAHVGYIFTFIFLQPIQTFVLQTTEGENRLSSFERWFAE